MAHAPVSRQDAQRRADRIRAFRIELEQLERDGALVLNLDQKRALEQHHDNVLRQLGASFDIDATERQRQVSWGMRIVSTLGALALAAAVVLFFFRIWGLIPVAAQVTVLVAAPLAALLGAEAAARRESSLYFTSLISLVAFAAFILDLNVMGTIFGLTPTPHALLVWSVFALALAYRFRLRLLLAAGVVCAIGYGASLLMVAFGEWWGAWDHRFETVLLVGLAVMFYPERRVPEFAPVYRVVGLAAALIAALFLALNGASFLPLDSSLVEKIYQIGGMLVAAAAIWTGIARQWTAVVNLGAAAFILFLYIRLVEWWWDWMPKFLFFLIVGALSLALLFAFARVRARLKGAGA
jgi:uncharacterized membrane protein